MGRDKGQRTHCKPHATHQDVPERTDRVRGASETTWSFEPEVGSDGRQRTRITFEGIVDPKGRLPKSVINFVGKRTSINVATGLARLADSRWEASGSADGAPVLLIAGGLLFICFNALAYTLYLYRARKLPAVRARLGLARSADASASDGTVLESKCPSSVSTRKLRARHPVA